MSWLKPIEYKTVKQVSAPAKRFYDWVKEVDRYHLFLPWCTKSEILPGTLKEYNDREGEFTGRLNIGFKALNFSYDSHIQYYDYHTIISTSKSTSIFNELYSKWNIQEHTLGKWMVNYEVKMTFSNPLYGRVTRYFFDHLVVNINDAFVKACNITYEQQLDAALRDSIQRERTVRDYLNDDSIDEVDRRLRGPKPKASTFNILKQKQQPEDFDWKADPRLNRRRQVQSKSLFEEEIVSKKEQMEEKRIEHSKNLIRDLFRDNVLSRLDRDKVNQKMQDKEFLKDIYLLDQALGGAPDYKKKIARHIKNIIE